MNINDSFDEYNTDKGNQWINKADVGELREDILHILCPNQPKFVSPWNNYVEKNSIVFWG